MGALVIAGAVAVTWFLSGLLYANAAEWLLHRFLLHGVGKQRTSFWHFHWGEHHRNSRRDGFYDADYERSRFGWHAQGKEHYGLLVLLLLHLPLLWVAPWLFAGLTYGTVNYLVKHRRSHLDPDWARRHLPWHYDHHMGKNQDANWCVTRPLFDWIMGTREPYAFTDAEALDMQRRSAAAAATPDRTAVTAPQQALPTTLDAPPTPSEPPPPLG